MREALKRHKVLLIFFVAAVALGAVVFWPGCQQQDVVPVAVADNATLNTSTPRDFLQDYLTLQADYAALQQAYTVLEAYCETLRVNYNNLAALPPSVVTDSSKTESQERDIIALHEALALADSLRLTAEQNYTKAADALMATQSNYEVVLEDYEEVRAALHLVNNRGDSTISDNLTATTRAHFYEGWGLWWPTLPDRVK